MGCFLLFTYAGAHCRGGGAVFVTILWHTKARLSASRQFIAVMNGWAEYAGWCSGSYNDVRIENPLDMPPIFGGTLQSTRREGPAPRTRHGGGTPLRSPRAAHDRDAAALSPLEMVTAVLRTCLDASTSAATDDLATAVMLSGVLGRSMSLPRRHRRRCLAHSHAGLPTKAWEKPGPLSPLGVHAPQDLGWTVVEKGTAGGPGPLPSPGRCAWRESYALVRRVPRRI